MREILFLAHRIPWPADRGDKIRSHHILKRLCEMAPVHVGTFADDERDMGFVERDGRHLRPAMSSCGASRNGRRAVEALVTGSRFRCAALAAGRCRIGSTGCWPRAASAIFSASRDRWRNMYPASFNGRFIMDFVDVDSAKFESYAGEGSPLMRWINAREGRLLAHSSVGGCIARRCQPAGEPSRSGALFRTTHRRRPM